MKLDETTLIEIQDYIDALDEKVGLRPGTVEDVRKAINKYRTELKNLRLVAVSDWLELEGNESVFNEYAKANCWCKFDDGTECRYEDEHPIAVMTHFRCK